MKDQKKDSSSSFAIKPEQLASQGASVLDFLVDYFNNMAELPVRPSLEPGSLAAQFAAEPPQLPKEMNAILKEIQDKIMPGVTHWQHPQFFAYYPATTSIPAMQSSLSQKSGTETLFRDITHRKKRHGDITNGKQLHGDISHEINRQPNACNIILT
tara:strand:- start:139 stop:606 length:468 start_codon:yes stop_codon:yes gene_type:complete